NLAIFILSVWLTATAAHAQVRILPLGDSVTSSFSPQSSYRYWLWQYLNTAGYDVDFVGTRWGVEGGGPGNPDFDQHHDGHAGWNSQDGVFNINSIAASTVPDVVLLDLSSNDILDGIPPENSLENLVAMMEALRAVNPDVIILLAQPTPFLGQNKRAMSKLRGAIKKSLKIEKKAGLRVYMVNLAGSF